jgi:hypothetical protein
MARKKKLDCVLLGFLCILFGSLGLENDRKDFLATPQSNCGVTVSREAPEWEKNG